MSRTDIDQRQGLKMSDRCGIRIMRVRCDILLRDRLGQPVTSDILLRDRLGDPLGGGLVKIFGGLWPEICTCGVLH